MFERKTETVERSSWKWTDPTPTNANGKAFNGNWVPVAAALLFVAVFTVGIFA
ncbi:hypothetical protein [Pararhizobium qamdonense]|uniref:hypothetical protein n=1 Tax=Pararhizobium qamdonense TaxID=3031126 RepID=UPI0023E245D4|nr:hypothetical protein [Pararhizobium qamdonense]